MDNTGGVKAAQHGQGEARRSDVILRPLRRLCVLCSLVGYQLATKIYSAVSFVRFSPIMGEIMIVKLLHL